jgi:hypothetical protein
MISTLARVRVASVIMFVFLAVSFLAAQRIQGDQVPNGKHGVDQSQPAVQPQSDSGDAAKPIGQAVVQGNGINYHGGAVLHSNPVPIYVIWYGNWTNGTHASDSQTTVNLIDSLLGSGGIGGSGYERINTTYGDNSGNVSGNLVLSRQVFNTGSNGTSISDATLQTIVSNAINNGSLPRDGNGVYLVLTSSNVNETSGFCTQYCGFHTRATLGGVDIKYAFVGNPDRCPSGCEAQTTSPNGDSGADGMANVIAHETEEAITDPDLNAWFDASGQEDADKCNFRFGPTSRASNGSAFNQTFGGHNWLIQMEWENSRGGGCDLTLGGAFH